MLMLVIGLTGGIGAGKSSVSRFLAEMGARIIDADTIGHDLYLPYSPAWKEIVKSFGRNVITADDKINRQRLGELVFNSPEQRKKLNSIMMPRMAGVFQELIIGLKRKHERVVVLEAAILIESGWDSLVDKIWVVQAPKEIVVRRLEKKGQLSSNEIKKRIESQISHVERMQNAQVVINNTGSLKELRVKVEKLWESKVTGRDY